MRYLVKVGLDSTVEILLEQLQQQFRKKTFGEVKVILLSYYLSVSVVITLSVCFSYLILLIKQKLQITTNI